MKITQLKISLHQSNDSKRKKWLDVFRNRYTLFGFVRDEHHYLAEAIEYDGQYFYRVDGITVEARQDEYERVISNPRLYYFSSALKLHHRIKKAKELGIGYHWPTGAAAPVDIFNGSNPTGSRS